LTVLALRNLFRRKANGSPGPEWIKTILATPHPRIGYILGGYRRFYFACLNEALPGSERPIEIRFLHLNSAFAMIVLKKHCVNMKQFGAGIPDLGDLFFVPALTENRGLLFGKGTLGCEQSFGILEKIGFVIPKNKDDVFEMGPQEIDKTCVPLPVDRMPLGLS
jgi:hypothetical protein